MLHRRPTRAFAVALALAAATLTVATAQAQTPAPPTSARMVDANKDGMVSRQEFMDAMGRLWDERARQMKLDRDRMRADEYEREVMMYLRAGG